MNEKTTANYSHSIRNKTLKEGLDAAREFYKRNHNVFLSSDNQEETQGILDYDLKFIPADVEIWCEIHSDTKMLATIHSDDYVFAFTTLRIRFVIGEEVEWIKNNATRICFFAKFTNPNGNSQQILLHEKRGDCGYKSKGTTWELDVNTALHIPYLISKGIVSVERIE